jgi:AmiR/NasT family two-component response regulator
MDSLCCVRSANRGWQGPAILITAYFSPNLVDLAVKEGFSSVLEKPLHEHALTEALSRLTGQSKARRAAFL